MMRSVMKTCAKFIIGGLLIWAAAGLAIYGIHLAIARSRTPVMANAK